MSSFYSEDELKEIGFRSIGENVLISRKASIYGAKNIAIGNNVRIDDFCILSGKIEVGNYVHISAYVGLFGGEQGIVFEDYSGISSRGAVYAESDDYGGEVMTNPMIPMGYRHVYGGEVHFGKHCLVGSGSTILPGVKLGEGAVTGAMSLVIKDLEPWTVNAGIPCRILRKRSKELLKYETRLK